MKILAALILSCASLYGADNINTNAPDITTKVLEREREGGKTRLRLKTISRNNEPILRILRTTRAGVTKVSRSYEVGEGLVMVETDEDGDGLFEAFSLFRPGKKDMEMFIRQLDGTVKPVSTQTLLATKKQVATVDDAVGKLFLKDGLTDRQFEDLIQATQRKIGDAEKEKSDVNK